MCVCVHIDIYLYVELNTWTKTSPQEPSPHASSAPEWGQRLPCFNNRSTDPDYFISKWINWLRNLNEAITCIQAQVPQGQAVPNGFAHSGPAWITLASVGMDLLEELPDSHLAGSVLQGWQCLQIGR